MALSISYRLPAEALHYYAEGSVLSDSWAGVTVGKKNALYDAIIAKLVANKPVKVLDIGCGRGGLAQRISSEGALSKMVSYVGIDLSAANVNAAKALGLPAKFSFEVQNAYEYLSQTPCTWDFIVSTMFVYGHDSETLTSLRKPLLRYARKGFIIAAGVEYQDLLTTLTSDIVPVSGDSASTNMVVATKVFDTPQTTFPPLELPLRARLVETGAMNYALADLSLKNTGVWPATVQGVTATKTTPKVGGSLANPTLTSIAVVQKVKV